MREASILSRSLHAAAEHDEGLRRLANIVGRQRRLRRREARAVMRLLLDGRVWWRVYERRNRRLSLACDAFYAEQARAKDAS